MKYFRSRYNVALELLSSYTYPFPFHLFAKDFFKKQKKFGSKDRKAILEVCYSYFRSGKLFENLQMPKALLLSSSLLPFENSEDWNQVAAEQGFDLFLAQDYSTKYEAYWTWLNTHTQIDECSVFYPKGEVMETFESLNKLTAIGFRPKVWAKDHNSSNEVFELPVGCFELEEGTVPQDFEQVQDLSSQTICGMIELNESDKVWDVCCGAGGKSLNLLSRQVGEFYLSDVRPTILANASQRIQRFGYTARFGVVDLEKQSKSLFFKELEINNSFFDVIIADVPCSGSGTWFRTPEHFTNFDYQSLAVYTQRQKNIVSHAIPFLKSQGLFYYITCSVFEAENTEVKSFILNNLECDLVEEVAYNGMTSFSDSMYMCCFRKR